MKDRFRFWLASYLPKTRDNFCLWFVKKLPKRIRYWVYISILADATTREYSGTIVTDITAMEVLDRIPI